jgi:hypothetical protein
LRIDEEMIFSRLNNVVGLHDRGVVKTIFLLVLVVIWNCGHYLHGQELGEIPAGLEPSSMAPPPEPAVDGSAGTLRHLSAEVTAEIVRIREQEHLPRLKPFGPWEMAQFCDTSRFGTATGVHHMGSNPIVGTRTVLFFEAHSPLSARQELEEVAVAERPHGKHGKLAIDDAHRISVWVCPSRALGRYRVVVGYWYSKLGVFLDGIPRGSE